jgi:TonB family protein
MHSLAQHEVLDSLGSGGEPLWAPKFLVDLPPWPDVFFGNLADLLNTPLRRRRPKPLTVCPAPFWPDVFVNRRLAFAPFRQSALYHFFLVVMLWGLSHTALFRPRIKPVGSLFENTEAVYFPVSEYLPPLNGGSLRASVERKGRPAYARQRIVSLPLHPDNLSQTIIAPSLSMIHQDVPLPNIVAWNEAPVPPAPMVKGTPHLLLPPILQAVAPPPQIRREPGQAPLAAQVQAVPPPPNQLRRRTLDLLPAKQDPLAPPPETHAARLPALPLAAAAPPLPEITGRPTGGLILARLTPEITPRLAPEQQARWIKTGARDPGRADLGPPAGVTVPALPAGGSPGQALKSIVALGLNPVMPSGPISVPQGNRRGEFMAGPEGKPGAPGTPEIHGGGPAKDPGSQSAGKDSPLEGIMVAAGAVNPGPVAVSGPAPQPALPAARTVSSNLLLAAMRPVRATEIARQTRPGSASPENTAKIEDTVFGPKKYYSMTLNMPNFTSAGGSWIIRFAELKLNGGHGDVTAPVATVKVDPAYPEELREQGREGVVVLYAIIRADGSVDEVRVLRGVNARLDASARAALMKWHFQPGTKGGSAVDLEAVVQVPFKARTGF